MLKRGQVSIFILLGVILVIVSFIVFYITSYTEEKAMDDSLGVEQEILPLIEPIKQHIQYCLTQAVTDGVNTILIHGGYIAPSGNLFYNENGSMDTAGSDFVWYMGAEIPVYFEHNLTVIKMDQIKDKLEKYIVVEFGECLDLEQFNTFNFQIAHPNIDYSLGYVYSDLIKLNLAVGKEAIFANLFYPIKISTFRTETVLRDFEVILPSRLGFFFDDVIANITFNINDSIFSGIPYLIDTFDCDDIDVYNQTIIYSKKDDYSSDDVVIYRIIDYLNYANTGEYELFQFAVKNDTMNNNELNCVTSLVIPP